ncbi:MAG: hypothetical protein DRN92_04910, partial [Thermoproteota archaeon]
VGGVLKVTGSLKFDKLDVGGKASVSGRAEGREVEVGGAIVVGDDLILKENLDVGGTCRVRGLLKARSMKIGGGVEADLIKAEDLVKAGGYIKTSKGVKAREVRIGRRGEIKGPVVAEEVLIEERARVEDIYADEIVMEERSRARSLHGRRIYLERRCRVLGEVEYVETLEKETDVEVGLEKKVEEIKKPEI